MDQGEELQISSGQRLAGNIIAGALIILCGLFLLLVGTGVIGLRFGDVAPASCLFAVGITLLITALIQRNCVSLWLSFVFNIPAAITLTAAYTTLGYGDLYPFFIAIPAVASLFTLPMTIGSWKEHLKVVIFFGLIAFLFLLNSLMNVGWGVVVPLFVVLAGVVILWFAVSSALSSKNEWEE